MTINRRRLIQSGLAAGTLTGLGLLKPSDKGSGHSSYFENLSQAIKRAELSRPTLIIDKSRLDANIATLNNHINKPYDYRIVVKSLPSIPLLKHISKKTHSQRFMVFNEYFLLEVIEHFPKSDILLGKPLPVLAAKKTLENLSLEAGSSLRWLVDSLQRLDNYRQLANQRKQSLRLNLEIDIGLHRGGFAATQNLNEALTIIKNDPFLVFDGFMGYEPHVVKVPGNANKHLANSLNIYRENIEIAKSILADGFPTQPLFNTAGSPSYQLHTKIAPSQIICNELSAGSCLVKPSDFDLPSLEDHQAACFIATPVLKTLEQTQIPGISGLGQLMSWWNPNLKRSLFTYGGNWQAQPVSPEGLSYNPLYGRSSNQEMINASSKNPLGMDDWIFLRPTQSESVFLQFGDLAIYDGQALVDFWPIFS